jgi:hypothetical protein
MNAKERYKKFYELEDNFNRYIDGLKDVEVYSTIDTVTVRYRGQRIIYAKLNQDLIIDWRPDTKGILDDGVPINICAMTTINSCLRVMNMYTLDKWDWDGLEWCWVVPLEHSEEDEPPRMFKAPYETLWG